MNATIGPPLLPSAPRSSLAATLVWGYTHPTPVSCECVAGEVCVTEGADI